MRKNKLGIIILDNPHREIKGARSLSKELKKRNLNVIFSSKTDFKVISKIVKPDFIIHPKPTSPFCEFKSTYRGYHYCIPCEHGHGIKEKVLNHFGEDPETALYIGKNKASSDRKDWNAIFLPGKVHKSYLVSTKNYEDNNLIVTGTLNSDIWMEETINGKRTSESGERIRVGISTTFKSFMFGITYKSIQEGLGDHLESDRISFLRYELEYLRLLIIIINENPNIDFFIRPHPHESIKNWQILEKKLKNLFISKPEQDLTEWILDSDVIISSFSTTSIDVVLNGKPSISLHELIRENVYEDLPAQKKPYVFEYSLAPKSIIEASDMIKNRDLNIHADVTRKKVFERYKDIYTLDRNFKASRLIAEHIEDDLKELKAKNSIGVSNIILFISLSFLLEIRRITSARKNNLLALRAVFISNLRAIIESC